MTAEVPHTSWNTVYRKRIAVAQNNLTGLPVRCECVCDKAKLKITSGNLKKMQVLHVGRGLLLSLVGVKGRAVERGFRNRVCIDDEGECSCRGGARRVG